MATKVTEAFGVVKDNQNQGCGGIVEEFHQLKYVEKTIAAEGKDMVVAEAEATVTPTARSSMETAGQIPVVLARTGIYYQ